MSLVLFKNIHIQCFNTLTSQEFKILSLLQQ